MYLPMPTEVTGYDFFCLSVYQYDISKINAARSSNMTHKRFMMSPENLFRSQLHVLVQ